MYLHPISLSTFWDFHLLTYSPLPVSLWWTIPTILNLFLHGWPSENESMKVTRSSEDHLRLENCQQLEKKRCSEYRKLSTWWWSWSGWPTLSWRKTSRVASLHLHLRWSKSRQEQRSSTDLFQTPSPPQDPCKPSPPQDPYTPCSPLDNYESLPFSVTGFCHGIVKTVNRTRTLETKLNITTCHLSHCHWVKRAQLTDVSSLPPTPSAPTPPVCTPPLQPSRKPDNLHFCCNYLLSQLNKEIFTNLTLWQGFNNIRNNCIANVRVVLLCTDGV